MRTDIYGQKIFSEADLCDLYMKDPARKTSQILVDSVIQVDDILDLESFPDLAAYVDPKLSPKEYDEKNQATWWMPEEYKVFDIAKWVLDQCSTDEELQRAGDELIKFSERDMFDLLKYLKYLVDTMRRNNIVWGVGRGSSTASHVLFLIGIHKINSLFYNLSIDEFLK